MTETYEGVTVASPSVHPAENLADAFAMFDGHVPLTAREKKLILQSLYDLAFREGARQGRQAGIEHMQNQVRARIDQLDPQHEVDHHIIGIMESLLPQPVPHMEYPDPTTTIRTALENKQRAIAQINKARNGK